jgi:ERCC4-type nuclease
MLKIDLRETHIIEACSQCILENPKFSKIQIVHEVLLIGDMSITIEGVEKVIIERKTLADLSASIKDGRYEEQSYRLANTTNLHNHNILYLIEGLAKTHKNKMEMNTLYSAMFSLNHYKGFSLFRSADVKESANILCNMTYKMQKSFDEKRIPFYEKVGKEEKEKGEDEEEPVQKDYCKVVKKSKKENITSENIHEIMLQQIPGIQSVTSCAIIEQFTTIGNLIDKITEDPACLNNLTYNKEKPRKLSKTVIASIIKYLRK